MMPISRVLAAFGIGDAQVRRQPSFTSVVHRVSTWERRLFLKQHGAEDAPRIRLAADLGGRLSSARFVPTADGELYASDGDILYTLTEPAGDRPLSVHDLGVHDNARRLGEYLAQLHETLNRSPVVDPPPSMLWRDGDQAERIARSRAAIRTRTPSNRRDVMLRALDLVEQTPAARAPLAAVAGRTGVVHGDFWPGNVIVAAPLLSSLAVVDLESACRAPLLLDVAHFADLGFRSLAGWRKTREMDPALATTFARAYAAASSVPSEDLRALPDLLTAARGCSILWLVERHLDIGPNPTDQLVENDLSTIQFVTRIANRWRDDLSATVLVS
jgi:Ser/Thr protein kinase RdoA (MazF antagonist)